MSILKTDCFLLGYISKPHGHRGELQLIIQTDLPTNFVTPHFAFVEISEKLVPFFLTKFEFIIQDKAILGFEDIDSLDKADRLTSHLIYLKKEAMPAFEEAADEFHNYEIIGFTVIDETLGTIGIIEEIEENAHQPMLIVISEKGEEILIPLVTAFIKKVNKKSKQIKMNLPDGLVE